MSVKVLKKNKHASDVMFMIVQMATPNSELLKGKTK